MKPSPFTYERPASVEEALALLATREDARLLAGGQSLLPMMNLRLARPATVVDVGGIARLRRVLADGSGVLVGALCRHCDLATSPLLARRLPVLRQVVDHIGHPAIRNRGTLGGSLAHADPAAELPALMALAGATVWVESAQRGRRAIPAEALVRGHYHTALEADEMLTWVHVPDSAAGGAFGFYEHAPRAGDFAEVGALVRVAGGDGTPPAAVRAVTIGVGDGPQVLTDTPGAGVRDRGWCEDTARRLARSLATPPADAARTRLLDACLRRALRQAVGEERARG